MNSLTYDHLQRPLRDLRISVTDRCNFRCTYCMPAEIFDQDYAFMPRDQLLTFEEIERLASIFAKLGVKKIRLTGGEPLMRRDLPVLIKKLMDIDGIEDIGLTTNGVYLVKHSAALKAAGLQRVNVSLDAMDDEVFKKINGRGVSTKAVLNGIEAALKAGLAVKVNMVVKKGMNDQEIIPMVSYFKEKGITLRFIEFMDVGSTNGWNFEQVVSKKEIYEKIHAVYPLEPVDPNYFGEVAKLYRYKGTNTEVGFITSVSESFCSSCTRARISAEGKLYTCLFATKGFDLKTLVRSEATDEDISKTVTEIWNERKNRYSDERTEETAKNRKRIEMSYIGG